MKIGVLQLIDSLDPGGAERMAVNYANALHRRITCSALCTTRLEGPLKELLEPGIPYLFLNRKKRLDYKATLKLKHFIRNHGIQIIQAHGSSYFMGAALKLMCPDLKLIWHDHYGESEYLNKRPLKGLKIFSRFFDAVFSVNESLRHWARGSLNVNRVYYLKNFIAPALPFEPKHIFPGKPGKRIVCVANFRPQKNHQMLLDAFEGLLLQDSEYTLHMFGKTIDTAYAQKILDRLEHPPFVNSVFYQGAFLKLSAILPHFDMGVLSSKSEGLPLALLEYAQAGLAVVVTDVGQCREVVGDCGICVSKSDPEQMTRAFIEYASNTQKRAGDAQAFQKKVMNSFGAQGCIEDVLEIYDQII